MKGHPISYSADELEWIEAHRSMPRPEAYAAFQAKFDRPDIAFGAYASLCKRKGWMTGRDGRFEKGQTPVNKGVPCPPGRGGRHPNARKTQFRKGNLPHNTKYLGHERVSVDGYVEISIAEVNPHTGFDRRYVLKHRHLWEEINGPVPDGMALKCLDGNRLNTDPANWEAVPRNLLPMLAGGRTGLSYDQAAEEVRPALMTLAKLRHAARQRKQEAKR
jgi:hypothetical protein